MRGLAETWNARVCTSRPQAEQSVAGGISFSSALAARAFWVMN